jgi:hypothetical protein
VDQGEGGCKSMPEDRRRRFSRKMTRQGTRGDAFGDDGGLLMTMMRERNGARERKRVRAGYCVCDRTDHRNCTTYNRQNRNPTTRGLHLT